MTQHGRLIVSDTQRNRLQIYNKLKNYHHGGAHHLVSPHSYMLP